MTRLELNLSRNSIRLVADSSFSIRIILRLLSVLHQDGKVKRTNLAGKTGLNYKQCIKYMNLLLLLGWTSISLDEDRCVMITDKGIEIIEKLDVLLH